MRRAAMALALAVIVAAPTAVEAQVELLGPAGLGRPLAPLDSRARILGGAGVALHGANLAARNPASLVKLPSGGFWATFMPENRDVTGTGISGDVSTADFPLARAALPFGDGWAVSLAFGSFLDQDWAIQFEDTLRTSTGDVAFRETRSSDGGIGQFRLDIARAFSSRWSIGLGGILYSGETRLRSERAFLAEAAFSPSLSRAAIQYTGWGLEAGVEFRPFPEIIVGAVAGWNGDLEVRNDSSGASTDVDLPLSLQLGSSWQLTRGVLFALDLGWTGWSALEEDVPGSDDTFRAGGGIELLALRGRSASLFLRVGGHLERLPFEVGENSPVERAFSFGFGARFAEGRGRIDAGLELGSRGSQDSNGMEESFTRASVSLAVFAQ